jgi:hypothetical protein
VWSNDNPARNNQAAIKQDHFDCNNYASFKTQPEVNSKARMTGQAARYGSDLGAAALLAFSLTNQLSYNSEYRACMAARGWTEQFNGYRENGFAKLSNGGLWSGNFKDNYLEGEGTLKYPNGEIYQGTMQRGLPEGYGTWKHPSGDTYSGYYRKGKWHGTGKFTSGKGDSLTGEFTEGVFVQGVKIMSDGKKLSGRFEDGYLLEGEGTVVERDGKKFSGIWRRGRLVSGTEYPPETQSPERKTDRGYSDAQLLSEAREAERRGEFKVAANKYLDIFLRNPNNFYEAYQGASLLLQDESYSSATIWFEKISRSNSRYAVEALRALAQIKRRFGKIDDEKKYLDEIVSRFPNSQIADWASSRLSEIR